MTKCLPDLVLHTHERVINMRHRRMPRSVVVGVMVTWRARHRNRRFAILLPCGGKKKVREGGCIGKVALWLVWFGYLKFGYIELSLLGSIG